MLLELQQELINCNIKLTTFALAIRLRKEFSRARPTFTEFDAVVMVCDISPG